MYITITGTKSGEMRVMGENKPDDLPHPQGSEGSLRGGMTPLFLATLERNGISRGLRKRASSYCPRSKPVDTPHEPCCPVNIRTRGVRSRRR